MDLSNDTVMQTIVSLLPHSAPAFNDHEMKSGIYFWKMSYGIWISWCQRLSGSMYLVLLFVRYATDASPMCIYVPKETVQFYLQWSTALACFIDASKAFDMVCYLILLQKLIQRGVPLILCLFIRWYLGQQLAVQWGDCPSIPFCVSNAVRQGGVLSPHSFSLDMDPLTLTLKETRVCCYIPNILHNHNY